MNNPYVALLVGLFLIFTAGNVWGLTDIAWWWVCAPLFPVIVLGILADIRAILARKVDKKRCAELRNADIEKNVAQAIVDNLADTVRKVVKENNRNLN